MENEQKTDSPLLGFLIVAFLVLLLIGCAILYGYSQSLKLQKQQEIEASNRAHYTEHNQSVSTFPHAMNIDGKTAYLERIDVLELYGNHSYFGYVIITIDRGQLSDDDVHWIMKGKRYNWELDASAHYWPDGTDGEIDSLHFLSCRYDGDYIYFIFNTDEHRYSLKGTRFSMAVTYLADGADYSDQYRYSYSVEFSGANYHNSVDHLPEQTIYVFGKVCADAVS